MALFSAPCAALFLLSIAIFTATSDALYCICKDGVGDTALQKALDYACGNGADCSAILQSGSCYNPNTVKSHCDYAVNSYFQRKNQVSGSCDFAGSATTSATIPTQSSGCVYQSSPGGGTPTGSPPPPGTISSTPPPPGTYSSTPPPPPLSSYGFGPPPPPSSVFSDPGGALTIQPKQWLSTAVACCSCVVIMFWWS
uniref:X8 domain-containing protein n=1 Tax=Kalanchoe fedtschenkoi TaxID=63787 RepID=A0A7N0TSQ8_KALFE